MRVPPSHERRYRAGDSIRESTTPEAAVATHPKSRSQPLPPTGSARSVRAALAGLALSTLLASLGTSAPNVALPEIARALAVPFAGVQWVVLAYLLGVTTLMVGAARLGDVVGPRRMLLGGIALFTAASAACGLAPALGALVAARGAQGVGAAAMLSLSLALAAEIVPAARTARAVGLLGTMSALGTALGPALGGALVAAFGWRAAFVVNVPLGAAAFALSYWHVPRDARRSAAERESFDSAGTTLLAATLAAYALAMTGARQRPLAATLALLAGAAVGALLFVRVERTTTTPLVRPALLRGGIVGRGLASHAIVSAVLMATLVVGPFYLARGLGLPPASVGLALAVGPLVTAACGVPAGRLAERVGTRRATVAGLIAIVVGAASLALLPTAWGVAAYVAPIGILTAGYALFQTANGAAVLAAAAPAERRVVGAMLGLSRNVGLVTGAAALGALFAIGARGADVSRAAATAVAAGMRLTYAVAAALGLIGLAVATWRAEARRATHTARPSEGRRVPPRRAA